MTIKDKVLLAASEIFQKDIYGKRIDTRDIEDKDYLKYIYSGHPQAINFIKNEIRSIDTSNAWVDILDCLIYKSKGFTCFNYIIFEVFPRTKEINVDKSITRKDINQLYWETAKEDIRLQRSEGKKGKIFVVLTKLVKNMDLRDVRFNILADGSVEVTRKGKECVTGVVPYTYVQRVKALRPLTVRQSRLIMMNKKLVKEQFRKNKNSSMEFLETVFKKK